MPYGYVPSSPVFDIAQSHNQYHIGSVSKAVSEYFEEETTEEEMMNIIFELLETWKRKKGSAQNE